MTLKALEKIGTDLGLSFTKNHSREKRARMILDAYNELDLSAPADSPPSTDPLALGEPKPAFEQLIDGPSDAAAQEDTGPQRGGARPGAGRPEGMTDELAAYGRLSPLPHPAIKAFLERFFDAWSRRVNCPEIKLNKEEAVALALAWTHAYDLTPFKGRLPPWLMVLIECAWTTYAIGGKRLDLAAEAAKRRRAQQQAAAVPSAN